jgi:hypothetical protein
MLLVLLVETSIDFIVGDVTSFSLRRYGEIKEGIDVSGFMEGGTHPCSSLHFLFHVYYSIASVYHHSQKYNQPFQTTHYNNNNRNRLTH